MTAIAFFDLDETLVRGNTGSLWIRYLRQRREIGLGTALRGLYWVAQYRLSLLDIEQVTARVVGDMKDELEQVMISRCAEFVTAEVLPLVSDKAKAQLEHHRSRGDVIALLSSATPYVAMPVSRHVGIEHIVCTRLEIKDGKFTGDYVKPLCYGPGKIHWAEKFASAHQLSLNGSVFYTDSYSDLPMLERVEHPHVINPDPRLRRHAKKVGWPIEIW